MNEWAELPRTTRKYQPPHVIIIIVCFVESQNPSIPRRVTSPSPHSELNTHGVTGRTVVIE